MTNLVQSQKVQKWEDQMSIQEWNHTQRQVMLGSHVELQLSSLRAGLQ